jgi:hypothetical protein
MVIKLKEYGKYVIGVGIRESASDLLIQNCDEYYSYNDLAGLTKEVDTPSTQRDPWELAGEAVAQMFRNGDVMRSDRLKQVMQQIDPNFDERNAGFNRFSKFVIEAGLRGVVLITKLDNGQYEVAPGASAKPAAAAAAAPQPGREEAAAPSGRSREDGGRGRRGRRGRGGRDRSPREGAPHRDRMNGSPRPEGQRPAAREERPEGGLTLARAFQLMAQALSEFRSPVGQEALRLRMVAMHGREDALLDAARFPRLLRQANDAEVADVRKVGDDDYEISAQGGAVRPALPPPSQAEDAPSAPVLTDGAPDPVGAASRENGQRLGLRFRRGSRGPTRAGEIPLIGVVRIEPPVDPVESEPAEATTAEMEAVTEEAPKRPRPRRSPRKRAVAAEPSETPSAESAPEAPPVKRTRTRSRKKPE